MFPHYKNQFCRQLNSTDFPRLIAYKLAEMSVIIGHHALVLPAQAMHRKRDNHVTGLDSMEYGVTGLLINLFQAWQRFEHKRYIDFLRRTVLNDINRFRSPSYPQHLHAPFEEVEHLLMNITGVIAGIFG